MTVTSRWVSIEPQPSVAPGRSARSTTVFSPDPVKACVTVGPVAVAPSPKSQAKVAPRTSRSPTNAASNEVTTPSATLSGPTMLICGAATTLTVVSSVSSAPQEPRASPVIVSVTV